MTGPAGGSYEFWKTKSSLNAKAIENQLDVFFIAYADYTCNICKKIVNKGMSHAHPKIRTKLPKRKDQWGRPTKK